MNNKHECTKFKTAFKRNRLRMIVRCRDCGERRIIATPHGKMAGPVARLPK